MAGHVTRWIVQDIINSSKPFVALTLNASVNDGNKDNICDFWKKASFRVSVDGGTNLFHKYIFHPRMNNDAKIIHKEDAISTSDDVPLPDFISGDFDSIDHNIMDFYKKLGVQIIHTPDQNATDFQKALMEVDKLSKNVDLILVFCHISGWRFDHVLSFIEVLLWALSEVSIPVVMMADGCYFWMLSPGRHNVQIPIEIYSNEEASWCGLAAFGQSSVVTTSGLKYNLNKHEVAFGKLISTSNTYADSFDGTVAIECSHPLLWMMGRRSPEGNAS